MDQPPRENMPCQQTHRRKLTERVYFSAALQPLAEKLPGRLRVLRIPEAPRACLAKNRPERVESVCIFQQLGSQSQNSWRPRVLRIPEAPRAAWRKICQSALLQSSSIGCAEKIPQGVAGSLFQQLCSMLQKSCRPRVLRIPEAPRACLAKNRPERVDSVYFSIALQPVAEKLPTARLENT